MATVIDLATGCARPARPSGTRLAAGPDAELIRLGQDVLRLMYNWNTISFEGLTNDESDARTLRFQRRVDALCDRMDELQPDTLAGLAMVMRVDLARYSDISRTTAMMRSSGPTEEELKPLSAEEHNLWIYIDHLERLAGLREPSTSRPGA